MGARIASFTRIAAKGIPAAIICCVANSNDMYTATVVRESVVRNECDAREGRGRKAKDDVAQHGHFLSC